MNRRRIFIFLSIVWSLMHSLEAWSWQASRRAQGRRQLEIKLIDHQVSTVNGSTYSFTVNLPPPSEDRVILVAAFGFRNEEWRALTDITMNGTALTHIYGLNIPIFIRAIREDTLVGDQTFQTSYNGNLDRSGIAVFEVYGWGGFSDQGKYQNEADSSKTYNWTDVPKGSKIICLAYNVNPNVINWTNAVEAFDVTLEASDQASLAILDVPTKGSHSLTVASSGGAYSIAIVLTSEK